MFSGSNNFKVNQMCLFKIKGEGESKLLQLFSGSEKTYATEILITV